MSWDDDVFGTGGGKGNQQFPDPQEMLNKMKEKLTPKLSGGIVVVLLLVLAGLWGATGIYVVNTDEQGVVMRFGRHDRNTEPGLHWHLPFPIEQVYLPKVKEVKRIEIGFRTVDAGPPARYQSVPGEALMLTGDENIVSAEFIVQYQIRDPEKYLFNVEKPNIFVRDAAEAAMREVLGRRGVDDVLTEAKNIIQIEALDLMQFILDDSDVGIVVHNVKLQDVYPPDQVIAAFRDVASAREDRETVKNQAEAYANDIIPKARGEGEKRLNEAQAYRETKIKEAQGDAARFTKLYDEYKLAKEITRKRLYLNAMAEVLGKTSIVVSDSKSGGVFPMLPLKSFTTGKE
jgi:membrane protease subunit HflK